jgi:GntR family transcriptional regulator
MVRHLNEAISKVYGHAELRLLFLECNSHDAEEMAGALSQALGCKIEHCVLDAFLPGVPQSCRPYDLLITTYHHLGDVMDTVRQSGGNPQSVIGIDTRPSADTMLQIAHLRDRRIGLVATLQNTAHMLKHLIFSYHPEWEITAVTQDQRQAICSLVSSSDHLIVTHTCAADVELLTGRAADVVVNFAVDEHSIQRVKARVQQAQQDRLSEVAMLQTPEARGI